MKEPLLYIVRLWGGAVGSQASFRAAVLRAGTDESAWFTQSEALTKYLEQQIQTAAANGRVQPKEPS